MKKVQMNFSVPEEWKEELEKLAREEAVKENRNITYLDLIRRAVREKYNLRDDRKG